MKLLWVASGPTPRTGFNNYIRLASWLLLVLLPRAHSARSVQSTNARQEDVCGWRDLFLLAFQCEQRSSEPVLYLLYDVNPSEGFNLRRDVYIRMAVLLKYLRTQPGYRRTRLVLPPWSNLVHWRSHTIDQSQLMWSQFFDLPSLKLYTDVLDMDEFFEAYRRGYGSSNSADVVEVDEVYKLRHFDNMFEQDGAFVDKFEEHVCPKSEAAAWHFFGYGNFTARDVTCLHIQGSALLLHRLLRAKRPRMPPGQRRSTRTVLVLNAEIMLHDLWGNRDYWEARRSMRFARHLVEVADHFRRSHLNSSDEHEGTVRPARWTDEQGDGDSDDQERPRVAQGGPYLCAHLRRADFLYGRDRTTPSVQSAALQIRAKLLELGLRTVFVASDCSRTEFYNLRNYLKRFRVVRFEPESYEQRTVLKDGGIAIIDQIVCSHSHYFVGTYESTFTYRIYEEREILGFPTERTFNTLCKSEKDVEEGCEQNAVWPIVY
ncbi:GDP-fucose protein O-fucosyltransferase 2-like [Anopheles albimanus]|uniref:GDP-fucose protein O-fucosyltransferase 2 n=1 Tax=Anopheles albimanus TaxID=7167 RepID=A0A182FIZ5_ANOAL|nr:GDP-fucose protein O-fucosyltransferase 2-like [Anopheles albimanus]